MEPRRSAPAALPFRAPAAALLLSGLQLLSSPVACTAQVCDNPVARGGPSKTWPVPNPMLVAPVNVTYNYESYSHPMLAEYTGKGISIRVPPDFQAGFNMTNPANGSSELYALRFMLLRKPGKIPEGTKQVLSHVFEVSMIHQEMTGTGYWADVVVPFEVGEDSQGDMLTHLVDEAQLPTKKGEVQPVLISDARPLKLNRVWDGASFYTSWTTLPTGCQGVTAGTRQLMRNTTLMVSVHTFHRLLDALQYVPEVAPELAPSLVWELVGCPEDSSQGTCVLPVAESLDARLTEAQSLQSTALIQMRNCKDTMDEILVQIQNNSLPSVTSAIAARENLKDAQAHFEGAAKTVDNLQNFIWQAGNATWDSDAPASARTSVRSLLQAAAFMASTRRSPFAPAPSSSAAPDSPVLNLLFGSGRPVLRHTASKNLRA